METERTIHGTNQNISLFGISIWQKYYLTKRKKMPNFKITYNGEYYSSLPIKSTGLPLENTEQTYKMGSLEKTVNS